MPTEKGIIENTDRGKALVRVQRNSACAHCESRGMCQMEEDEREMVVEVENLLGVHAGDQVEIMVPTGSFMKISLMVYMLPVLAFVFGAFLGDTLARGTALDSSLAAIIGGAVLMVTVFYLLRKLDRVIGGKKRYTPRLTRILRPSVPKDDTGSAC